MENKKRLIDANELLAVLKEKQNSVMQNENLPPAIKWSEAVSHGRMLGVLKDAPTVDAVEVVHGRWEYIPMSEEDWRCTNCKEVFRIPPGCHPAVDCGMNYCPNCGAKMDGDENA